jgi:hypothetical protein
MSAASRLDLGLTHPPMQWVPDVLSPGVKQAVREVDHPRIIIQSSRL